MNHPTTRRSRAKPSRVRPSRLPAGHAAALRRPRRALQPRRTRRRRARRSGWSGSGARSARCNRCSDTANAACAQTFPPNSNRIGARSCFGRRDSASWLAAGAANAARVNDGPSLQLNVAAMSVGRRLIPVPTRLAGACVRSARGRTRTGMALRPRDFKSLAYTRFATRAGCDGEGYLLVPFPGPWRDRGHR